MTWTSTWSNPQYPFTVQRGYGTGVDWQSCYIDLDDCNAVCQSDRNTCFSDFSACATPLCNTIIDVNEQSICNSEHLSVYTNNYQSLEYFNVWANAQMGNNCPPARRLKDKTQTYLRSQRYS
jgi:hypothetical protein